MVFDHNFPQAHYFKIKVLSIDFYKNSIISKSLHLQDLIIHTKDIFTGIFLGVKRFSQEINLVAADNSIDISAY